MYNILLLFDLVVLRDFHDCLQIPLKNHNYNGYWGLIREYILIIHNQKEVLDEKIVLWDIMHQLWYNYSRIPILKDFWMQ